MPAKDPSPQEIEESIVELLQGEKVLTLATLDANGYPSVSHMHYTADGLTVYMHTFVYTRKHGEILKDPRVAYAIDYSGIQGYEDRFNSRSLQAKGRATVVTSADEIAHVAQLAKEKNPHSAMSAMFDNVKTPDQAGQQIFLRVDPVEALWADHRIRLMWRVILDFNPDNPHVTDIRSYDSAIGRRQKR